MGDTESFGRLLQKRRKLLDMTQEQLAQKANCSVSAIRKIESEVRRPSREIAELLAESLDVPSADRHAFVQIARGLRSGRDTQIAVINPATFTDHRRHSRISNLPVPATPLVGRAHELAEIGHLLQEPNCRLISITGRGGVGKTRLAIAAALLNQKVFTDGVHFISVLLVKSTGQLVTTIADSVGFAFFGQADPTKQLFNFLSGKNLLLILDSFEHLLLSTDFISDLLVYAPEIKLMLTSYERINFQGEWVYEINGLSVPATGDEDNLKEYYSVSLFIQSAARARPGFVLKPEDHQAVAKICQLLEGLPLGIVLAASWVRLLSCQEIAREIEKNLDFVATTARDLPERHRSLRAIFNHSWSLLSPEERHVLTRMSVFQGSFTREAAEKIVGANLNLLLALTDKSIFCRTGDNRFELHNLIQQYARTQLLNSSEEYIRIHDLLCRYYCNWLKSLETKIKGRDQADVLSEISTEIDNIRLAWDWAIKRYRIADVKKAARCLSWYYQLRGLFVEWKAIGEVLNQLGLEPANNKS